MIKKIVLKKSELLYSIQNKTHITGEAKRNGDNYESVAAIQASNDEGYESELLRSTSKAIGEFKVHFAEYIHGATADTAANGLMGKDGDITIELSLPANFNPHTLDSIAESAHAFVVNSALANWFAMTNPSDSDLYYKLAMKEVVTLRSALNRRSRPKYPSSTTTPTTETGELLEPKAPEPGSPFYEDP